MSSSGVAGLTAAGVWAAATRTLSAFAFRSLLNFGAAISNYDATANVAGPISSATADAFGAWVAKVADVGAGRMLIGITVRTPGENGTHVEIEVGEGAAGSEAAIARVAFTDAEVTSLFILLYRQLTDNARLSMRARSTSGVAQNYLGHALYV